MLELVLYVFGGCLIGAAIGVGIPALCGAAKRADKCCGEHRD